MGGGEGKRKLLMDSTNICLENKHQIYTMYFQEYLGLTCHCKSEVVELKSFTLTLSFCSTVHLGFLHKYLSYPHCLAFLLGTKLV